MYTVERFRDQIYYYFSSYLIMLIINVTCIDVSMQNIRFFEKIVVFDR